MISAVVQKLKVAFADTSLPTVGGLSFSFTRSGPTTDIATIKIGIDSSVTTDGVTLRFDSILQGEFFSDSGGTASLGNSVKYTSSGQKTLYCKTYTAGNFKIDNAEFISELGTNTAGDWGPTGQFISGTPLVISAPDIAQFGNMKRCKKLVLGNGATFAGDISVLANLPLLTGVVMAGATNTSLTGSTSVLKTLPLTFINLTGLASFDLAHMPNTIYVYQISAYQLSNSGSTSNPAIVGPLGSTAEISSVADALTTSEADTYLQAVAASIASRSALLNFRLKGARSSASDAAFATLSSKNYNVVMF